MQLRQVYVCFTFFGLLFWSFFRDIHRNVTLQHLRLQSEWMNDWESVKIKPMSHNRSLKMASRTRRGCQAGAGLSSLICSEVI